MTQITFQYMNSHCTMPCYSFIPLLGFSRVWFVYTKKPVNSNLGLHHPIDGWPEAGDREAWQWLWVLAEAGRPIGLYYFVAKGGARSPYVYPEPELRKRTFWRQKKKRLLLLLKKTQVQPIWVNYLQNKVKLLSYSTSAIIIFVLDYIIISRKKRGYSIVWSKYTSGYRTGTLGWICRIQDFLLHFIFTVNASLDEIRSNILLLAIAFAVEHFTSEHFTFGHVSSYFGLVALIGQFEFTGAHPSHVSSFRLVKFPL